MFYYILKASRACVSGDATCILFFFLEYSIEKEGKKDIGFIFFFIKNEYIRRYFIDCKESTIHMNVS